MSRSVCLSVCFMLLPQNGALYRAMVTMKHYWEISYCKSSRLVSLSLNWPKRSGVSLCRHWGDTLLGLGR